MNSLWSKILAALAKSSQWGAAIIAALNFLRLNTPDTTATTADYTMFVGIPAGLAALINAFEGVILSLLGGGKAPDQQTDWLIVEVSKIVQRLLAEGRTEEAKQIVALIPASKEPTP